MMPSFALLHEEIFFFLSLNSHCDKRYRETRGENGWSKRRLQLETHKFLLDPVSTALISSNP